MDFGKIKKIPLKKAWKKETEFREWLFENIHCLEEVLGFQLEATEQEATVGDFSLDLLAKDLDSNSDVTIELQFNRTDHDHMGKLLTYAAGIDAKHIVWVAEKFREEHRQTLDWLNQNTDENTNFFGIIIELLQIDDSKPAYNFEAVVTPNEWQKTSKKRIGGELTRKAKAYREFFQALIDELRTKHKFTSAKKGQPQSWSNFVSGIISGVSFGANFTGNNEARVEVYIDVVDQGKNKELFDWLLARKNTIEKELGVPLDWQRLDEKRACRIALTRPGKIFDPPETLSEIQKWMIETLLDFKKTFAPHLNKAKGIL